MLDQIADVPDERRGAAFVCAAALATPDGAERVLERPWRGTLIREKRGTNGFGYDPVFVPDGIAAPRPSCPRRRRTRSATAARRSPRWSR